MRLERSPYELVQVFGRKLFQPGKLIEQRAGYNGSTTPLHFRDPPTHADTLLNRHLTYYSPWGILVERVQKGRSGGAMPIMHCSPYTGPRARVVPEDGGWSVSIPGVPIAADGASLDEAVNEMIEALREYAEDWGERLLDAPNHRENSDLVELVGLSSNDQLREWLVGKSQ